MSGRILIVDDVPTNRIILKAKLTQAYFEVIATDDAMSAVELIRKEQPDLVLLDVMMPGKSGYELCSELKSDPELAHLPVIMITALESSQERIRGLEAGADDFLTKPFDDRTLIARVRNLMRVKIMFDEMRLRDRTSRELGLQDFLDGHVEEAEAGGRVLLAASDANESTYWSDIISAHLDVEIFEADGENSSMQFATKDAPDIFIVHQHLSDGTEGLRLVSGLRSNRETRQSAIIFVADEGDVETSAAALDLGASDYIQYPFDPNELLVRIKSQLRRKRYSDRLRSNVIDGLKMAVIDPLTGLYNRRYAEQHMQTIAKRAVDEGSEFAVLMMDLDAFKAVNDLYGHRAGDLVLAEFARRLQENVRGIDLTARLGGEEFCIVMPDTDTRQAAYVAERLRETMESRAFVIQEARDPIHVTVSIGVASSYIDTDPEIVLEQADRALYLAKSGGRNLVKVFSDAA